MIMLGISQNSRLSNLVVPSSVRSFQSFQWSFLVLDPIFQIFLNKSEQQCTFQISKPPKGFQKPSKLKRRHHKKKQLHKKLYKDLLFLIHKKTSINPENPLPIANQNGISHPSSVILAPRCCEYAKSSKAVLVDGSRSHHLRWFGVL